MENTIYQFTAHTLQGKEFSFDHYRGYVLLIVNTATGCGRRGQFAELEFLFQKYKDKKFIVIGFPSDDFAQEPLSGNDIETFCSVNYGVTFPIMNKISVKGENKHPVFQFFSSKKFNGKFSSRPRWNFYKYLIGRDGRVIDYFWTYRKPTNKKIMRSIEKALSQKPSA